MIDNHLPHETTHQHSKLEGFAFTLYAYQRFDAPQAIVPRIYFPESK